MLKNSQIRLVSATAASRDDLQATLEYVRDVLEVAQLLQRKMDSMPDVVKAFMEENGWESSTNRNTRLSLVAGKLHIEAAISQS